GGGEGRPAEGEGHRGGGCGKAQSHGGIPPDGYGVGALTGAAWAQHASAARLLRLFSYPRMEARFRAAGRVNHLTPRARLTAFCQPSYSRLRVAAGIDGSNNRSRCHASATASTEG